MGLVRFAAPGPRSPLPPVPGHVHIPFNDLRRGNAELLSRLEQAAKTVVASGWYALGAEVAGFEAEFAEYCGAAHCAGVASGTDALAVALTAVGVQSGDRVATVANAGGYSTCAILSIGAVPQFIEVDDETLAMSPSALASADVAAVIVTHLYGRLADVKAIAAAAAAAGIPLIEDCAQAHGARLEGRAAGTFGAVGCFSFYPTKNLGALGDGGATVTNDAGLHERILALRQYGWTAKYRAELPGGRNSRLDELQAAFLRQKLPHLDAGNDRRRSITRRYTEGMRDLAGGVPRPPGDSDVGHLFVIRHPARDVLRERLRELEVATDVHYPVPDHRQAAAAGCPWAAVDLPVTDRACREVLSLPCFPELTDEEVDTVIAAVSRSLEGMGEV